MIRIKVDPYATTSQLVGYLPQCLIDYYRIEYHSNDVHMAPGALKHLKKRGHWNEFLLCYRDLPNMIANPDYAGQNPNEPGSVELYKSVGDHVLIAIKLDPAAELFLGSFCKLNNGSVKIRKRLRTGRIYAFSLNNKMA